MDLFKYINVMFSVNDKYDDLTPYDKTKNAFMLNRFMSIKFPTQANLFNELKTNPVGASEAWRMVTKKFKRVPGWVYTKTKKSKKKTKEWAPNEDVKREYLKLNQIGEREFKEALQFNQPLVKESLDQLEKQMNMNA